MKTKRFLSVGLVLALVVIAVAFSGAALTVSIASNGDMETRVSLTGPAIAGDVPTGHADFRARADGGRQFNVEVEDVNLPAGTVLSVLVDNVLAGHITINGTMGGELELNTNDGQTIPTVVSGSKVTVTSQSNALLLSGVFPAIPAASPSPTPSPSPSASPSPSPGQGASSVQFADHKFRVSESTTGSVTIPVTRTGSTAGTVTVDFSVGKDDDGSDTANQHSDFTLAAGTLTFAPGDTTKSFVVLINKVAVPVEKEKEVKLVLSNVKGNAVLGNPDKAELEIDDDDVVMDNKNPIDNDGDFVSQHYHDFLNREAEPGGFQFWQGKLDDCGADAKCLDSTRTALSAAFYISREFQDTGFFVVKTEKVAFNRRPQFANFIPQVQKVSREMADQSLEAAREEFVKDRVDDAEFHAIFDSMRNDQFIDALYHNAEVVPDPSTRALQLDDLNSNRSTRAGVLRDIIENNQALNDKQYNPAFVLMQYFGYLRRDPDEAGLQFWIQKLNSSTQSDNFSSMVHAFITAAEYRDRFHQN